MPDGKISSPQPGSYLLLPPEGVYATLEMPGGVSLALARFYLSGLTEAYLEETGADCLFFFDGSELDCCCLTTWATPTFRG